VGLYRRAAFAGAGDKLRLEFVESWHDHPLLVAAFAEKLAAAWSAACARANARIPVIFTAHSVPERTIEAGDPYEKQAKETAALVAARLPELAPELWRFAFQSQGMSGGKWLGPTVEEPILELKAAGHREVLVQPIGFVCDHIEVLYDIDIGFTKFARENRMELTRTDSLNDSALFIDALAALAQNTLESAEAKETMPAARRARS
jgi:ferrochelatase